MTAKKVALRYEAPEHESLVATQSDIYGSDRVTFAKGFWGGFEEHMVFYLLAVAVKPSALIL
jgi:hypothetical protein